MILHTDIDRIEWRLKPDASEIADLAECAKLPVLETVAEIESQLAGRHAVIWKQALGGVRAAGVAATVALGVTAIVAAEMPKAEASEHGLVRPAGIEKIAGRPVG
jgi:hypothetical protein